MKMVWDDLKRRSNLESHGLDFADAYDRFEWPSAIITPTYSSARGGARFIAVGFLDGNLVTLIFSTLGTEAISAISLRPASRKERRRYAN